MGQTNLTVRIDEGVKQEAEALFDKIGMNMSTAVNVFFRQAIREQAIPFPIKAKSSEEKYDEYFNPKTMERILHSIAQAERGQTISFTMAELEAMEDGEVPQRAIDFMEARRKTEGAKRD